MLHTNYQGPRVNLGFQRCRFKQTVDDARRKTDDGHWPMAIAHPEPMLR